MIECPSAVKCGSGSRLDIKDLRVALRIATKDLRFASDLTLETCIHLWTRILLLSTNQQPEFDKASLPGFFCKII